MSYDQVVSWKDLADRLKFLQVFLFKGSFLQIILTFKLGNLRLVDEYIGKFYVFLNSVTCCTQGTICSNFNVALKAPYGAGRYGSVGSFAIFLDLWNFIELCFFAFDLIPNLRYGKFMLFSTDLDECSLSVNNCHPNSTCTNTIGSYICKCIAVYTGDGITCTGIFVLNC